MRRFLGRLIRMWRGLRAVPEVYSENRLMKKALEERADAQREQDQRARAIYMERVSELIEARQMAGAGPWHVSESALRETDAAIERARRALHQPVALRESNPLLSVGAFGDLELALQNVEWRREVNLSWLEFSRWGIQQLILISRLRYIKNPLIRRVVDIAALYVFGQGFEVTSSDPDAAEVLKDFWHRNRAVLGQTALTDLERRKYYDGNIFFVFFADTNNSGEVSVRTIDAVEVFDIVTDPDDSDKPQYYRRKWTTRVFNQQTGSVEQRSNEAWYPALSFAPDKKPDTIGGFPVMWDSPIYHRKAGGIAKWLYGCPIIYPALEWAELAARLLQACASIRQSLSQIAMTLSTKGGQQAIEGAKQQLQTTVGPSSNIWDANPPAVNAAIFASGPGTTLSAFNTRSAGGDPEEVRQFKLMVCMTVGVPETFLADVSTGNLATATTLDRPTELCFYAKQEEWQEDLGLIGRWVLEASASAPSGKLREARKLRKVRVLECEYVKAPSGRRIYEAKKRSDDEVDVLVNFPAIREGDAAAMITAIADAMTLGNKGGQVVGIDEKVGVGMLYRKLEYPDWEDVLEKQYPEKEYDPDRTKEPLPAPIGKAEPAPGGEPQAPGGHDPRVADQPVKAAERLLRAMRGLKRAR